MYIRIHTLYILYIYKLLYTKYIIMYIYICTTKNIQICKSSLTSLAHPLVASCLHAIRHAVHRPAPLRWDSMFNPLADQESNGKDIGYHWMIMPISHGRSHGRPWTHDKSAVSPTFLSTTQQHEDHRGHSSGCHDWQVCLGPMQLVEKLLPECLIYFVRI